MYAIDVTTLCVSLMSEVLVCYHSFEDLLDGEKLDLCGTKRIVNNAGSTNEKTGTHRKSKWS